MTPINVPYCRNCGRLIGMGATVCLACGVAPPKGDRFCSRCGGPTEPLANACTRCGTTLRQPEAAANGAKSKTAAILLAVFLSFFTWLYTYRRDYWKFWIGLAVAVGVFAAVYLTSGDLVDYMIANGGLPGDDELATNYSSFMAVTKAGWIVFPAIWLWAVVDSARKDDSWYKSY